MNNKNSNNDNKEVGRERSFVAGMLKFAVDEQGKRSAVFYIMNTSRNRNRWAVTDKALEEALPTLKGKPLGLGAGYRTDKHYPDGENIDVAKFVSTQKPGHYALASASGFEDEKVWVDMQAGRLGATSVVIYSYMDTCSKCGANLSELKDPYSTHSCLSEKGSSAYVNVESFRFKRVDFVDVPAYPQAGLTELAGAQEGEGYTRALELLAGVYESQELPILGITKKGAKKDLPEKEQKEIEEKMANLEQKNKELQGDIEAAKQASAAKDKELKELKAKLEKTVSASDEVKELKAQLEDIRKEKHDGLVAAAYEARKTAGIAAKEEDEKKMLAELDDKTLEVFRVDALKVASITQKKASAPSVKYEAKSGDDLQAAVNTQRAAWGLPPLKTEKETN